MSIYSPKDNDEFIVSLKEWIKSNPLSPEDFPQEKIPAWNKGFSLSEEWRENISRSMKGKIQGINQRNSAKVTAAIRNTTIIECEKCGKKANLGNYKRWHGVNCGKSYKHSEKTKQKISTTMVGREFSVEHKEKISESNRRRKGIKFKKKTYSSSSSKSSQSTIISQQNGQ